METKHLSTGFTTKRQNEIAHRLVGKWVIIKVDRIRPCSIECIANVSFSTNDVYLFVGSKGRYYEIGNSYVGDFVEGKQIQILPNISACFEDVTLHYEMLYLRLVKASTIDDDTPLNGYWDP